MDALNIADGAAVADIGAGAGWFTIRLARRVGPERRRLRAGRAATRCSKRFAAAWRARGCRTSRRVLGDDSDPNLPARHARRRARRRRLSGGRAKPRRRFLRNLAAALKPGGRIGIVNYKPGERRAGPGRSRVDSAAVEADARAAGLRVLARENLPYQYLLVLGR